MATESKATLYEREEKVRKQARELKKIIIDDIIGETGFLFKRDELEMVDLEALNLIWRAATKAGPNRDFWGPKEDIKEKERKDTKTKIAASKTFNRHYKYPEKLDPNYHKGMEPVVKEIDFNTWYKYPEELDPNYHGKQRKAS